jgi:chromosome segregation protein
LEGIQTLFENIEDIKSELSTLSASIEEKKAKVENIEQKIEKVNNEKETLDEKIQDLNSEKKEFWKINELIQEQIDKKNKELEEVLDNLRALENIQRIIDSIEELAKENNESREKIKSNENIIEELTSSIEDLQEKVNAEQKEIDTLRKTRKEEIEAQKTAQKKLNNLNQELQEAQTTLNNFKKDKEREDRINSITKEISEKETQIKELTSEIDKNLQKIEEETERKDNKQAEIEKLMEKKDESWEKQKSIQNTISDLKSELSMEKSKLNNVEQKKIIVQDQIETLYQRSKDFGALPQITGEINEEELDSEIKEAVKKKEELEPVNLKAIKEYDEVKERFDEIDLRRQTIQRERKSILDAIDRIELEKTQTFMKAYHEINREFSRIFQKLSPGGSAKMILDRPDRPFEGGISIEARPRGKKIASLEILSGGEKTLVALSFIFAVQEFYPAPFYVMDEIDAALDGPNVHRVSMLIKEFAKDAQFLIISHREENIVNADRVYGVSMQESGITDIFSVDLEEEARRLLEAEEAKSKA